MSVFSSIDDVWTYLDSIPKFQNLGVSAVNYGLENIRSFCKDIGNPQNNFKSIHVAGTNGKGTTCYLLEQVYLKGGYTTGIFTSPHLVKYNERVKINGEEISDDEILAFFQLIEKTLIEYPLTYFEISTALALWAFSEAKVDVAIIETGLGGRLDSTNIIQPELSIITSIGIDHAQILGNTKKEIAKEKAGIIKSGTPLVVGNVHGNELAIILEEARSKESTVKEVANYQPKFRLGTVYLEGFEAPFQTQFIEPINAWNIGAVIAAIDVLKSILPVSQKVSKEAIDLFKGVPARFEKITETNNWYFSGAHNEQAVDAMLEAMESIKSDRKILVFTLMKDKISSKVLEKLVEFDIIYFFEEPSERGALVKDILKHINVKIIDESNRRKILNELKTELVIFAGSFYFYPTIKRWIQE